MRFSSRNAIILGLRLTHSLPALISDGTVGTNSSPLEHRTAAIESYGRTAMLAMRCSEGWHRRGEQWSTGWRTERWLCANMHTVLAQRCSQLALITQ